MLCKCVNAAALRDQQWCTRAQLRLQTGPAVQVWGRGSAEGRVEEGAGGGQRSCRQGHPGQAAPGDLPRAAPGPACDAQAAGLQGPHLRVSLAGMEAVDMRGSSLP